MNSAECIRSARSPDRVVNRLFYFHHLHKSVHYGLYFHFQNHMAQNLNCALSTSRERWINHDKSMVAPGLLGT